MACCQSGRSRRTGEAFEAMPIGSTPIAPAITETTMALHFIGFRDDRYRTACRAFGRPDFVHRIWDYRAAAEIADGDTAVFADGDETVRKSPFAYNDSEKF
jgi:hypothetical protein